MKFKLSLLIFCCFFTTKLLAQNPYAVKGKIADTAAKANLLNTSICVLNAKDSILRAFTRAGTDGSFAIGNLGKGEFILLVTYPGYADYVEEFALDSAHNARDFGRLNMLLKAKLLADVIIKGTRAAIKIKGDTTEFDARAFKIEPNAKVEDLLKQLPGIQVDKDGKITAQGQTVNKVLVDGEEFFGDDPTLVTKNIRADMVDKVQLYDKKSDQATFTGIDDGQKTKTINIKLKEDKKNGYFGKTEDGWGTNGYFQGQVLFNLFKAKKKFSVYSTLGNNGKTGLGWEDNQKYGSSDNLQFGDSGEIYFFGGGGDDLDSFDGRYNGQGTPMARTGGLHYDSKWNSDKESINTNYKIGSITVDGVTNNLTQNNLPDSIINSSSKQIFHNYMFRQKLDAVYQIKLDTSSNLKISVDGTSKNSQTRSNSFSTSSRNDTSLNKSNRDLSNSVDQKIFDISAFYTKKFKKTGRTFSFNISEAYNQSEAKGYLDAETDFYNAQGKPDTVHKPDIIHQYKTNNLKSAALNTNITYTEPLSKTFSIIANYGLGINNSSADRKSFNKSASGNYDVFDGAFSNYFKLNQLSNQAGAIINYKKGKTIINFGTKVSDVNFQQVDEYTNDILKRKFINWNPQASYQYRFSQQKSFGFSYNGNTTQPALDQIQPVRVNTDPLNIVLGNPGLKPSFTNRFNVNYNSFKILTNQYIWLYGSYSFTANPIVTDVVTDTKTGKSTSQPFNLPDKKDANFYMGANFDRKIEKLDMNWSLNLNANGNIYYNFANNALNMTKNYTYSPQIGLNKYKEKKYNFYISAGPTYTINGSSLHPEINDNGSGFNARGQFNIYLPGKIQIGSDGNYQYTAKTQSFNQDFKRFILNANITKAFLKSESLKFVLGGNDLLNQNVGFNRNSTGNLITQNSYTTIKRYFMLSIVYDFNKMGGGAPKK